MQLFFQSYPESDEIGADSRAPLIIIPGLFGSTNNWRSFARAMGEHYPVIVIDQRNHGRSEHADSHTFADMSNDLLEFIDQQGFERVIPCGHSMGGKTAMMFSLLQPERVERLLVLDIAPVTYQHSHAPFLDELMKIDLASLQSRRDAEAALRATIPDSGTRMFLLQSLVGAPGNYQWRLNLPVLRQYMPEIVSFPDEILSNRVSDVATVVVFGEESEYVQPQHQKKILRYFPSAQFVGIPGASHWLHIDQPKRVLEAVLNFVQQGEKNE